MLNIQILQNPCCTEYLKNISYQLMSHWASWMYNYQSLELLPFWLYHPAQFPN